MSPESKASQGQSRAAKKRAKKKQKKSDAQSEKPSDPPEQEHENIPVAVQEAEPKLSSTSETTRKRKFVRYEDAEEDEQDYKELASVPTREFDRVVDVVDMDGDGTELSCRQRGRAALEVLLGEFSSSEFYAKYWEQKPLLVRRKENCTKHQDRFDGLLSMDSIQKTLKGKAVFYGRDLNVTRYEKTEEGIRRRITLDETKDVEVEEDPTDTRNFVQASPDDVWANYEKGCSVRLLCPHEHSDSIQSLLSALETEWGCMVGANAYLTPPKGAQGFAPHYDDIEAFCLQLEGKKRWRVYEPLNKAEELPRESSADYLDADLKGVEPVLDIVLEPGDMLYMPRGWIHQACTLPSRDETGEHALHLTISAMQKWAWADLMEILFPEAVEAAASSSSSTRLREGLPRRFLDYMGAMNDHRMDKVPEPLKLMAKRVDNLEENENTAVMKRWQESFRAEAKKRIMEVANEAIDLLDAACDQLGKRFISDRQPPAWSKREDEAMDPETKLLPNHLCRLARPGIARMVLEDDKAVVYHCNDNSRAYHGHPLSPLEFELDDAPAIEQLLTTVEPHWICVADLVHDEIEDKIGVAQALYDEHILLVRK